MSEPENNGGVMDGAPGPYFHYLISAGSAAVASKTTIATQLGEAFKKSGVDIDYATIYVSEYASPVTRLGVKDVWTKMSDYQRQVIQLEFPELYVAIHLLIGESNGP